MRIRPSRAAGQQSGLIRKKRDCLAWSKIEMSPSEAIVRCVPQVTNVTYRPIGMRVKIAMTAQERRSMNTGRASTSLFLTFFAAESLVYGSWEGHRRHCPEGVRAVYRR